MDPQARARADLQLLCNSSWSQWFSDRRRGTRNPAFLLADSEPFDQLPIAYRVLALEVIEEAAAGTNHHE